MYTSETKEIKRAVSIKDTMMYDLCLAFQQKGHQVTLIAAEPFKPTNKEEYPFKVLWFDCKLPKIFLPHRIPLMPRTYRYIKKYGKKYDLIISSEVFSINSLYAYRAEPKKTIIWHELAKHNALMKKIPSKVWYKFITRIFMKNARIVARSNEAKAFIKQYCKNTEENIIDHGVNLDKFTAKTEKSNYFVVCSQLIGRKRIDGILQKFSAYLKVFDNESKLYIIGTGEMENQLKALAKGLSIESNVIFTGKLSHEELMPILADSKALLINTIKDNSMISIVESIAVGTPVLTTDVPLNAAYIQKYKLGIAKSKWDENDLDEISKNNQTYVKNCLNYRGNLSTKANVDKFISLIK